MVPASGATGAMGTGRCCGHRNVCAGNSVSGHIRSAVWMLLWPRKGEPAEEAEEVKEWGDLDTHEEDYKMNVDMMENLSKFICPPFGHF